MAVKLEQKGYEPCGCLAMLSPEDPRAEIWLAIFGKLEFPLKSPVPGAGYGPGEAKADFLKGDWEALSIGQQARLCKAMRDKFGVSFQEFQAQVKCFGYIPIKDVNITVRICELHTRCML